MMHYARARPHVLHYIFAHMPHMYLASFQAKAARIAVAERTKTKRSANWSSKKMARVRLTKPIAVIGADHIYCDFPSDLYNTGIPVYSNVFAHLVAICVIVCLMYTRPTEYAQVLRMLAPERRRDRGPRVKASRV